MELLAQGRDCDVFDLGDGTVLRRNRTGELLEREAAIMRHARDHGFPCPAVHRAEGPDMVLDFVVGPTLLHWALNEPTHDRAVEVGTVLASLHERLHRVPPCFGTTGALLHLDLHPGNVMLAPAGPVVIDWSNAADGDPALDIAMTWVIIAPFLDTGEPLAWVLLDAFLNGVDRATARAALPDAVQQRLADSNLDDDERAAVERFLAAERSSNP